MDVSKELIRGSLLYDFKVGLSAAALSCRICQAFEDIAVSERTKGIGFKNSGGEICPSGIKLEQDDHRPWMKKHCRRPLRRTVLKRVVNSSDNSTLPAACRAGDEDTIQRLDWKTLCTPPYLPDLAPSDYHLFHSLDNHLLGKSFTNEADVHQALTDFFASHTPEFYRKGIEQLETRWQKVLDADDLDIPIHYFQLGFAQYYLDKGRRVRTVPFALKGRVENEIDRLEKEGIIEKVDSSEWATPVVPVVKSDGSIRLCADYSSFEFDIIFRKTIEHGNADFLSRLPKTSEELEVKDVFQMSQIEALLCLRSYDRRRSKDIELGPLKSLKGRNPVRRHVDQIRSVGDKVQENIIPLMHQRFPSSEVRENNSNIQHAETAEDISKDRNKELGSSSVQGVPSTDIAVSDLSQSSAKETDSETRSPPVPDRPLPRRSGRISRTLFLATQLKDWYRSNIIELLSWPGNSPELNSIKILAAPFEKYCPNELWFQQDGATCHTARATIDLLKDTFGDRLISRFGPVNWPPRSCDLTPLDYFQWGYVKSLVYADKPQTLDPLEDNIRRVIADIRPQMLEKVIENLDVQIGLHPSQPWQFYARNHI
ncbi:integrase_H2C2 domain-containing protein [Trichonephila clavipes]|nr:integrase_H2C2 domain-containing protein [Trichonephila clavipes]